MPPDCIAAEINTLIKTKQLPVAAMHDRSSRYVPITVRGCFDLVAARGIRGGRGRCACHTQATTAQRFDVPPLKDDTTWAQAKAMLNQHPMLTAVIMRSDSHTPPAYRQQTGTMPSHGGVSEQTVRSSLTQTQPSEPRGRRSLQRRRTGLARARRRPRPAQSAMLNCTRQSKGSFSLLAQISI